ncbi:MAG: hypothetical protein MJ180_04760, partial [Candidatus Gastranaerophilales bacterium]|nr:hypothetical protein [Candidatus Gastranaerophilales bacterium]
MKRIFAVLLFLILFIASNEAFATKLPEGEVNLFKQTFSNVKVRFDGILELSDGTTYIPVFPIQEIPQNSVTLKQTIPKNKTLKDKPDFVMFNTNFAFFKLIRKNNKSSVVYNNEIPIEIKMGLLPQDLLVPQGFEIPGELRIIIGDLVIPVLPPKDYKEVVITQPNAPKDESPQTKLVAQAAKQLSNKYFYSNSFNQPAINILNADNGKAFKKILFSSIPSDIALTNNGKYLLVSTWRNGKVFVVDTVKTQVLKEIQAGEKPSYISVCDDENLAFIANRGESKITVIDLESMREKDPLIVKGNPSYMVLSEGSEKMFYLDGITGIVYSMDKKDSYFEPYTIKPLFKSNNISKIQIANDKIFTLDRGRNELQIYYLNGKNTDEIVNVSDISPIKVTSEENDKVAVDYTYEQEEEHLTEAKPKKSFKEKSRDFMRDLLYYNTPGEAEENQQKASDICDVGWLSP